MAVDQTDRTDAIAAERVRALALGGRVDEALAVGEQPAMRESRPVAVQMARACVIAERWERAHRWLDRAAPPVNEPADPAVLALAAHVALAEGDRTKPSGWPTPRSTAARARARSRPSARRWRSPAGRSAAPTHPPPVRPSHAASGSPQRRLVPWRLRALAELGALDMLESGDAERLMTARALAEECGMLGLGMASTCRSWSTRSASRVRCPR